MWKRFMLFMISLSLALAGTAIAKEVHINPITQDIRDKLKESTSLVSNVEDSMLPKINDLEKIYKTFNEVCKEREDDRGCVNIQEQIKNKYKDVLLTLENELPKVKDIINATARELERSVRKKTHGKDLKELYEQVASKGSMPKIRGPLSRKLTDILKAMGRPSTNISLLELSLQTQADLISAAEILDFLEAEISRQMVVVDMITEFGVLSPEIASVMKGVSELFGYTAEFGPVDDFDTAAVDDWDR